MLWRKAAACHLRRPIAHVRTHYRLNSKECLFPFGSGQAFGRHDNGDL